MDPTCILVIDDDANLRKTLTDILHLKHYAPVSASTGAEALRLIEQVSPAALEKRETEEALKESQRFLSTLIANLPGMAYRCRNDKERAIEFISEGCMPLTGYPPEAFLHNRKIAYGHIIHTEDRDIVWETVQVALQQQESFEMMYRIRTAAGAEKWVWEASGENR